MNRVYIADSVKKVGKEIKIMGWVHVRRDHGKLIFLDVRDQSGVIQVVVNPKVSAKAFVEAEKLRGEYVISIEGKIKERGKDLVNSDMTTGEVEIEATKIEILSSAEPLPFEIDGELNLDTFLDHQPLTLRSQKNQAVFKIQAAIMQSFREYLGGQNFVEFRAPKIVAQAAEGGADVFRVDYFGSPAYLAQSPQLYKQIMVGVFERAFTITNVFRAEPHATTRHINEYASLDYEMGFIEDHTDVMEMHRGWMEHLMKTLASERGDEFKLLKAKIPEVPKEIPTFRLSRAQEILKKEYKLDAVGAPDLDPEHERKICEYAQKKYKSDFVFITHYPTAKRPFYTYPDEKEPELTKSFDMLFRGVEITTGGQRIHDYKQLLQNIDKWGYKKENFTFYLEAFKYGMPPEGGCATGLERLTQKLVGADNVREVSLFPRDMGRIDLLLNKLKLDEEGGEKKDGRKA